MSSVKSQKILKLRESLKSRLEAKGKSRAFIQTIFDDENFRFCIEGYPRSANTFTSLLLVPQIEEHFQQKDCVLHHTHDLNLLKLATLLNKPTVVILRNPEDSVSSLFVYQKGKVEMGVLLARYIRFYNFVSRNQKKLLVADFSLIVSDINKLIQKINRKYSLDLRIIENLDQKTDQAMSVIRDAAIKKNHHEHYLTASIPNEERLKLKQDAKELMCSSYSEELRKAQAIYAAIRSSMEGFV